MSEDTAVARVEAFLAAIGPMTLPVRSVSQPHRDLTAKDLRELVAAARAWEAHTCGEARCSHYPEMCSSPTCEPCNREEARAKAGIPTEAEIREKVAQEIDRSRAEQYNAFPQLNSYAQGRLDGLTQASALVARGSAGGARP